jgi:hypothetical protein
MFRRTTVALLTVILLALAAGRADAVTIRDVIELARAGLSDQVLLALIEIDRGIFTMDAPTVKQLKTAGVSDAVILALIRSGRTPPPQESEPAPEPAAAPPGAPEPEVIVRYVDRYVDRDVVRYQDYQPPAPPPPPVAVPYPVAVPVYIPLPSRRSSGQHATAQRGVATTFPTDVGLVKARVPVPSNCVKAEPVYWGFGGKLRPDAWQPPPTIVCSR